MKKYTMTLHGAPYGRDGEAAGTANTLKYIGATARRQLRSSGQELRATDSDGNLVARYRMDASGKVYQAEI